MRSVDLHFTDSGGEGEAVLLAHALGCDHRMWEELAARLGKRFRVVAFDTRGHGRSPLGHRPYTLEILADDARALMDKLGVVKAHWVGLSMGGMVGEAFALRHPARLLKLVIANSTAGYGAEGRAMWQARMKQAQEGGLASIRDASAARWFSEEFRSSQPQRVDEIMARFLETPVEGYLGCCEAIAALDYADDLIRIRAKTLVIAGEADVGTPPAMSQVIAAKIPGAKLVVIPGAAHLSVAEKPAEFAEIVERFLAGDAPA